MNEVFVLMISLVASYLIGGINAAIVMARLIHHEDIRKKGSGNPGFTNYKRVYGKGAEAWTVFFLDILKTILTVAFSKYFLASYMDPMMGALLSGLATMLGHCFPVWYGFQGGKAFLSGMTTVYFVDWRVGLLCTAIFLLLLFTDRRMSLASVVSLFCFPVFLVLLTTPTLVEGTLAIFISLLVIWRHKANIQRLLSDTEKKTYLFGKH